jgi:hypothetical protein
MAHLGFDKEVVIRPAPRRSRSRRVAVGKTPGEHAGSLVRVGSEIGHLVRRTQAVRCEDIVHGGSEVHLRKRAARFLEQLYPTATSKSSTARVASCSSSRWSIWHESRDTPVSGREAEAPG